MLRKFSKETNISPKTQKNKNPKKNRRKTISSSKNRKKKNRKNNCDNL